MKMKPFAGMLFVMVSGALIFSACSSNKYNKTYRKVWKQVVASPEWEASLASSSQKSQEQISPFVKPETPGEGLTMDQEFIERYHQLVSRAYFRIIAEAENADAGIKESYEQLLAEEGSSEQLAKAEKRYKAHTVMLEGLKSWKAFSEGATADIEFFKAEHIVKAYEMLQKGASQQEVITYLMLEMADLYHVEEMRWVDN